MQDKAGYRIAQVVGMAGCGGVENSVLNYYRAIDPDRFQFDFLLEQGSAPGYQEKIKDLGGRVFLLPKPTCPAAQFLEYSRIFQKERYPIVHVHLNSRSGLPLAAAKWAGCPVRIAHSHSVSSPEEGIRGLIKELLRPTAGWFSNQKAACSKHAGEWLFGAGRVKSGEVQILPDAFPVERYSFSPETRARVREQRGLEGRPVIGFAGRLERQKNPFFLAAVFAALLKKEPNAVLLVIGGGSLERKLRQLICQQGAEGSVRFLGVREDVPELMQGMDAFLFPSFYEGLGMAVLEAQAAGLPVLASDRVPAEADRTGLVTFLSLEVPAEHWADTLWEMLKTGPRSSQETKLSKAGYQIRDQARRLEGYYQKLILSGADTLPGRSMG